MPIGRVASSDLLKNSVRYYSFLYDVVSVAVLAAPLESLIYEAVWVMNEMILFFLDFLLTYSLLI